MARARCALSGTKPATGIINLRTFWHIVKRWRFWILIPTYSVSCPLDVPLQAMLMT